MIKPPPPQLPAGSAPDGNRDLILSGMWVAKPFVPQDAFPEALLLTAKDRRLASTLGAPVCLCRRRFGAHVVELLLERGEDRTVELSLRIPTASNQFREPYLLMEAEPGNTREVGVREIQFHLQGRLADQDLAGGDWAAYLSAAARKLDALRAVKGRAKPGKRAGAGKRTVAATKRPATKRPATKRPATKRPATKRPAPRRKAPAKASRGKGRAKRR